MTISFLVDQRHLPMQGQAHKKARRCCGRVLLEQSRSTAKFAESIEPTTAKPTKNV